MANLDAYGTLKRMQAQGVDVERLTIGQPSDNPPLNRLVKESYQRVAGFYRNQGVQLGKEPLFKLVDDEPPGLSDAAMRLNIAPRMPSDEELTIKLAGQLRERYGQYGVSDEAIAQGADVYKERLAPYLQALEEIPLHPSADIVIYPAFLAQLEANPPQLAPLIADHSVAHELWHLTEERNGLLDSPLHESTADYAQYRYWQAVQEATRQELPTFTIPAKTEATLVQRLLAFGPHGIPKQAGLRALVEAEPQLAELLDPATRAPIEERQGELQNDLLMQYTEAIETDERIAYLDGLLERELFPTLAATMKEEGCNQPALIKGMRAEGLTQLADELEHRDIMFLLGNYARRHIGQWAEPEWASQLTGHADAAVKNDGATSR